QEHGEEHETGSAERSGRVGSTRPLRALRSALCEGRCSASVELPRHCDRRGKAASCVTRRLESASDEPSRKVLSVKPQPPGGGHGSRADATSTEANANIHAIFFGPERCPPIGLARQIWENPGNGVPGPLSCGKPRCGARRRSGMNC